MWSNFVEVNIGLHDAEKQFHRSDSLGYKLLLIENINLFLESILIDKDIFVNTKQVSLKVKELDEILHSSILKNIDNVHKTKEIIDGNFKKILKRNEFSDYEINNWDKVNLTKILFQYN